MRPNPSPCHLLSQADQVRRMLKNPEGRAYEVEDLRCQFTLEGGGEREEGQEVGEVDGEVTDPGLRIESGAEEQSEEGRQDAEGQAALKVRMETEVQVGCGVAEAGRRTEGGEMNGKGRGWRG